MSPRLPPLGSICAVWWDDPAMDPNVHDPDEPDTLTTCPKLTVGVLVAKPRGAIVLSHEAWLDGTAQQWVRTIILRRLITRVETIPGVCVPVRPTRR